MPEFALFLGVRLLLLVRLFDYLFVSVRHLKLIRARVEKCLSKTGSRGLTHVGAFRGGLLVVLNLIFLARRFCVFVCTFGLVCRPFGTISSHFSGLSIDFLSQFANSLPNHSCHDY